MNSLSDVAQIKAQIDAEAEAAVLALYGPAQGISKHQFITARMERMGLLHEKLKGLIGNEADQYLIAAMERRDTPQISQ